MSQLRIAALRQIMGEMSQKDFADKYDLNASHLSQLLTGHRALGERAARNLEEKIGITPGTLVSPGLSPDQIPAPVQVLEEVKTYNLTPISAWDDDTPLDDDEVEVPFLKEVELSAGSGRTAIEENTRFKLRFGKYTLRRHNVQPEHAVCVPIYGNSMEPVLRSGATVGVDRSKTQVIDGDIYALNHAGQLRVKQLYRLPGGGIKLRSFNREEHPDEEYNPDQMTDLNISIIGRVFWGAMFF